MVVNEGVCEECVMQCIRHSQHVGNSFMNRPCSLTLRYKDLIPCVELSASVEFGTSGLTQLQHTGSRYIGTCDDGIRRSFVLIHQVTAHLGFITGEFFIHHVYAL
jgi:hypothetical protein